MRRILPLYAAALLMPTIATAQSASTPTIQVTSRIVYIDIIVRNSAGQIVHGLTQQDFKLLEDGKPQKIDHFAAHNYNPVAVPAKPNPKFEFSNVSSPNESGAVTILLFDLLNTSAPDQLVARGQMLKFLKELPPGRRVSLFTLTARLQMIQGSTGSHELLTAAAKMLKPVDSQHMPSREEVLQDTQIASEFNRESSPRGHSPSGSTAMDGNVQTQDSDLGLRTYSTIAALTQLTRMMSGYQGRKNLFWVSEGFPVALNTTQNNLGQSLPVDAHRMTSLLADARIAVYPVSVLGLDQGVSLVAYSETLKPPDTKKQFFGRGNLKSAMNDIADQTGGHAIIGTNDLARAMRRELEDSSNYYTLAYQPQNKKWNRKFRSIRIELTQNGDSLTYRRGYFAYPDNPTTQNPAQELNTALQPETPESTTLDLKAKIDLPNPQHSGVLVHSIVDASSLNLTTGKDEHRRGQILVMLVAFRDNSGKPEAQPEAQHEAPPQISGVLNLDLDPAQYQTILKDGIAFTQQLQLSPGHYRLRLGVTDITTHRLGTLDMPIAIPTQTAGN